MSHKEHKPGTPPVHPAVLELARVVAVGLFKGTVLTAGLYFFGKYIPVPTIKEQDSTVIKGTESLYKVLFERHDVGKVWASITALTTLVTSSDYYVSKFFYMLRGQMDGIKPIGYQDGKVINVTYIGQDDQEHTAIIGLTKPTDA